MQIPPLLSASPAFRTSSASGVDKKLSKMRADPPKSHLEKYYVLLPPLFYFCVGFGGLFCARPDNGIHDRDTIKKIPPSAVFLQVHSLYVCVSSSFFVRKTYTLRERERDMLYRCQKNRKKGSVRSSEEDGPTFAKCNCLWNALNMLNNCEFLEKLTSIHSDGTGSIRGREDAVAGGVPGLSDANPAFVGQQRIIVFEDKATESVLVVVENPGSGEFSDQVPE